MVYERVKHGKNNWGRRKWQWVFSYIFASKSRKTKGSPLYKWPSNESELWLKPSDLLYDPQESEKAGRSGRSYAFRPSDINSFADINVYKLYLLKSSLLFFPLKQKLLRFLDKNIHCIKFLKISNLRCKIWKWTWN